MNASWLPMTRFRTRYHCWRTVALPLALISLAVPAFGDTPTSAASASIRVTIPLRIQTVNELSFGFVQSQFTDLVSGGSRPGLVIVTATPPTERSGNYAILTPGGGESPMILNITGGSNLIVRVSLPPRVLTTLGSQVVNQFQIWSQNSGDITQTGHAMLDEDGHDTIRIGGILNVPVGMPSGLYGARIPIVFSYE